MNRLDRTFAYFITGSCGMVALITYAPYLPSYTGAVISVLFGVALGKYGWDSYKKKD